MPVSLSKKYARILVDEKLIAELMEERMRRGPKPNGTRPAEVKLIRELVEARLNDKEVMTNLLTEAMTSGKFAITNR